MRVLITGGAGFIGSHIALRLLQGKKQVAVIDNLISGQGHCLPARVHLYEEDIRNWTRLRSVFRDFKPTHVIHNAGDISGRWTGRCDLTLGTETNVLGGINVLRAMMDGGAKKIIYASTAAVYGEIPQGRLAKESWPLRPASTYAASKASFELYLESCLRNPGIEAVILRYANVYGPRQRAGESGGVIATFARQLIDGKPVKLFARKRMHDDGCRRDYIYIDDAVSANILALTEGISGTFNVGAGRTYSTMKVLHIMARIIGVEPRINHQPPRTGELESSGLSPTRLMAQGWQPQVSLHEGIERTVRALGDGNQ